MEPGKSHCITPHSQSPDDAVRRDACSLKSPSYPEYDQNSAIVLAESCIRDIPLSPFQRSRFPPSSTLVMLPGTPQQPHQAPAPPAPLLIAQGILNNGTITEDHPAVCHYIELVKSAADIHLFILPNTEFEEVFALAAFKTWNTPLRVEHWMFWGSKNSEETSRRMTVALDSSLIPSYVVCPTSDKSSTFQMWRSHNLYSDYLRGTTDWFNMLEPVAAEDATLQLRPRKRKCAGETSTQSPPKKARMSKRLQNQAQTAFSSPSRDSSIISSRHQSPYVASAPKRPALRRTRTPRYCPIVTTIASQDPPFTPDQRASSVITATRSSPASSETVVEMTPVDLKGKGKMLEDDIEHGTVKEVELPRRSARLPRRRQSPQAEERLVPHISKVANTTPTGEEAPPKKRGRGRPRKHPQVTA